MKISKQILKLERVASKLGWEVTGDVGFLELLLDNCCDSVIFEDDLSKQEILDTITNKINKTDDEEFKTHLAYLYLICQRVIRTNYEEKKEEKKSFFNKLLTLY